MSVVLISTAAIYTITSVDYLARVSVTHTHTHTLMTDHLGLKHLL